MELSTGLKERRVLALIARLATTGEHCQLDDLLMTFNSPLSGGATSSIMCSKAQVALNRDFLPHRDPISALPVLKRLSVPVP